MLKALKALLGDSSGQDDRDGGAELRAAVATLLAEMARMDSGVKPEELAACRAALADLLRVPDAEAGELIDTARGKSGRLTSYFGPVSAINRAFSMAQRVRLIEHLWRVAYADGDLDPYEDHLVRKLSALLYVPHIDLMLGRQRARRTAPAETTPVGSGTPPVPG